ncbi:MAG: hypothetical protein ABL996_05495 [Micropepsaceae bacterium]
MDVRWIIVGITAVTAVVNLQLAHANFGRRRTAAGMTRLLAGILFALVALYFGLSKSPW